MASVLGVLVWPLSAATAASAASGPELVRDPAALVDPMIGTSGAVDTFPGPDMPFGMMQWGPDTTPHRTSGGGYEYADSKISGYSLTHISGPGCPVAGDVPILPVSGALGGNLSDTSTGFSHDDEQAAIGSYRLTDAAGITTELTDTTRAGLGRFTFPKGADGSLLLKLSGGATQVDGTRAQVVSDHEVKGAVDSGHFCGAANRYTLHFDIKFDRAFTTSGTWTDSSIDRGATALKHGTAPAPAPEDTAATGTGRAATSGKRTVLPGRSQPTVHGTAPDSGDAKAGKDPAEPPVTGANGMYLTFDTAQDTSVTAAVGISYTSDDNAAQNLSSEIRGYDLDAVEQANHAAWNGVLGRIAVGGGSDDQQVQFYTALYHALLHPNVFSDVNGEYMGMDNQVHKLARGQKAQYANYSGWDTYRSQTQLMAMVEPEITGDIVTSMLNGYDQTGLLPKWASNNGESYVMVGDPAAGIIASAYAFGARNFDAEHALDALVHQATVTSNDRPGENLRAEFGYLPLDGTYGCCNFYGPVSTQLEYDSADYAVAAFAKSLGHDDVYRKLATRAHDWMNVFNPQTGYMQGRNKNGEFAGAFTPATSNGFVEGTSAQYTPMVPFDVQQLATARGGTQAYADYLDSLLRDVAHPSGTSADLSNEPSVEIPWEYSYLGMPWKTQAAVRDAQQKLYFHDPVGSFGNDDLGAMSSWYVWSMLGAYPETPGTGTLVLGSPAFPKAQLNLPGRHGGPLTITAPQAAPDAPYVQALDVDGTAWNDSWLTFDRFRGAHSLDFTLGTEPDTSWASSEDAVPPSDTTGGDKLLAAAGADGGQLVLLPGGTGKGTLTLTNLGSEPVTAAWQADVPDGISLDSTSGSLTVPPSGRAEAEVTVTGGDTEGSFPVRFTLSGDDGAALGTASLPVAVAKAGALWPYESNKAAYPDGATFTGGFDDGGWAYSLNALEAAGVTSGAQVTADGLTYTWPQMADGKADNLNMGGQTIPQPSGTSGTSLGLLGAATNAPTDGSGVTGTLTVTYTDGTSDKADVTFSDWTLNGGTADPVEGNVTAVDTGYRNTADGGRDTVNAYVFAVKVPLDPSKTVASLTLPDSGAHLFALAYGK